MVWLCKRPDSKTDSILEILASKRLLIDHLEVLEECFQHVVAKQNSATRNSTFARLSFRAACAGCALAMAISARCIRRFVTNNWKVAVPTASALLVGVFFCNKYLLERKLTCVSRVVQAFENYDNAIKRSVLFINEIIHGNERVNTLRTRLNEKEILVNCVENCKAAIGDICRFITALEERTVILTEYDYAYEPMESLDNCDVFRQVAASQSQAKQLYNIFLYIQSHCLLRVALAVGSDAELSQMEDEVSRLVRCLVQRANDTSKLLTVKMLTSASTSEHTFDRKQPVSRDLLSVRNQSLDLAVRLATTLKYMTATDERLHTITGTVSSNDRARLEEAEGELAFIQSNLLTRSDECERLLISVKKLLNHVDDTPDADEDVPDPKDGLEHATALEEGPEPAQPEHDEFFVVFGTEGDECGADSSTQETLLTEEELVAKRLMKKQFRPVLRQLRERLEPIERSFKMREKDAMKRKGIELPDDTEPVRETPSGTGSDASDDDEAPRAKRSQQRYDDVRNFLASKSQINFLSRLPACGVQMEECILE
uniref:Vezatin n=1 Tax=Anopheles dirus TaxID=7168 RepID=A0A182NAC3_9DIPT